jgi:hypothetical protein
LWAKIGETTQQIESFNRKVAVWITEELRQARQQIISMVDLAFREQERIIRAYVSQQERSFCAHLLQTRTALQAEYNRIGELSKHLRGPEWRQAAGEIVASNLERRVGEWVREAGRAQGGQWEPKSFVREHLQIIQLQLDEIFKLSTFPG